MDADKVFALVPDDTEATAEGPGHRGEGAEEKTELREHAPQHEDKGRHLHAEDRELHEEGVVQEHAHHADEGVVEV